MNIESVRDYLGSDWTAVQELMTGVLQSDIALLNATNGAIMAHGGKQLRPILSMLVSRACLRSADTYVPGQKLSPLPEVSKRYAAASELLHNATLLHDDVADDSDMRRGNPTVRSLLGPSASVLVGDFWLVRAIRLILGDSDAACDPRVVRIFSRTLSCLAEGEMLQLQKAQTADTDYEDYLRIIYSKTASLFEAAAVTAAISVNASGVCREAVFRLRTTSSITAGPTRSASRSGWMFLNRRLHCRCSGPLPLLQNMRRKFADGSGMCLNVRRIGRG